MAEHWYSGSTQIYWTCKALIEGRAINHRHEIGEVNGWRLGAIVHSLRTKYDWPIHTDYVGPERIAHYRLPSQFAWLALEFPLSARRLKEEMKETPRTPASAAQRRIDGVDGEGHG